MVHSISGMGSLLSNVAVTKSRGKLGDSTVASPLLVWRIHALVGETFETTQDCRNELVFHA